MNTRKETILKNFRKNETFLNTTVKNNIEIHRKGTAKLIVTDENGKPIPGALVKFCQKSHEFKFGANLFMLDELETDEKNKQYKKFLTLPPCPFIGATWSQNAENRVMAKKAQKFTAAPHRICALNIAGKTTLNQSCTV